MPLAARAVQTRLTEGHAREVEAVEGDAPALELVCAEDGAKERRLAAAVGRGSAGRGTRDASEARGMEERERRSAVTLCGR